MDYVSYETTIAQREVAAAKAHAAALELELKKAREDLAKVKADVQWCMQHGIIRDAFNSASAISAGGPFEADDQDSTRLDYINKHGRVWLGSGCFCVAIPHQGGLEDETVPHPFNIRHIVDLCRLPRTGATTPITEP